MLPWNFLEAGLDRAGLPHRSAQSHHVEDQLFVFVFVFFKIIFIYSFLAVLGPKGFKGFPLVTISGGYSLGVPDGSEVKASASNVGDPGSIRGSGRSPGEGNGNPLQYSCLENPMDREAW